MQIPSVVTGSMRLCGVIPSHTSAIASVAMGILLKLRVADPMPPLDVPAVYHQLLQCFWGRPDAREKEMAGVEGFAVTLSRGTDLNDQLVPSHSTRIWFGASLARRVQVMSRPWPRS